MSETNENIIPRNKSDWKALAKNVVLVLAMAGSAYTGTSAANEDRLDRVENAVQRIENKVDDLTDQVEDNTNARKRARHVE